MALFFDSASNQYLSNGSGILAGNPISMAAWCNPTDTSTSGIILSMGATGTSSQATLSVQTGGAARYTYGTDSGNAFSTSVGRISTGTWAHVAGRSSSGQAPQVFLNGVAATPAAAPVGSYGTDRTHIGRRANNGTAAYFWGAIGECALWAELLTEAEIGELAKGISPLLVRPEKLRAYWPLVGRVNPSSGERETQVDVMGGYGAAPQPDPSDGPTLFNDHPRMYYSAGR